MPAMSYLRKYSPYVVAGMLGVALGYGCLQAYSTYTQIQALLPQIVQVINAHEVALQKLTGAPTIQAPPATPPK